MSDPFEIETKTHKFFLQFDIIEPNQNREPNLSRRGKIGQMVNDDLLSGTSKVTTTQYERRVA